MTLLPKLWLSLTENGITTDDCYLFFCIKSQKCLAIHKQFDVTMHLATGKEICLHETLWKYFMSLVLTGNGHYVISEIPAAIDKQIRSVFYSHFGQYWRYLWSWLPRKIYWHYWFMLSLVTILTPIVCVVIEKLHDVYDKSTIRICCKVHGKYCCLSS